MKPSDMFYAVATGPERRRRILTPVGLVIFSALLVGVVIGGLATDRALSLPPLLPGAPGDAVGTLFVVAGAALWAWCVVLFRRAGGTPVPFNPPRELVTSGPFAHVRNPILVGVFSALFGLGFLLHSLALVIIWTPAFLVFNVISLKVVEEPELERRFGESYREYRRRVPMFLPRIAHRKSTRAAP